MGAAQSQQESPTAKKFGVVAPGLSAPLTEGTHHEALKHSESRRFDGDVNFAWDAMQGLPDENRTFLDHLEIAHDCGLSEIGSKEELWYNSRYVSAPVLILFVIYNSYFILYTDYHAIMDPAPHYKEYLLSKSLVNKLGLDLDFMNRTPQKGVFIMECIMLIALILNALRHVFAILFLKGYRKWQGVVNLCWYSLPDLSIFSAIKLLQFVTPQQLSYDLNFIIFYEPHATKKLKFALFLITTPITLVLGLDCFLIKVRLAQDFIDSSTDDLQSVMGSVILLTQILGVVQIAKTIKNRLYRFVFAGEDGIMTDREQMRQDIWEAMVAQKIFACGNYNFFDATCLMLSWCDDDFQMMALNEDSTKEV